MSDFKVYPPVSEQQLGFFIDSARCSGCKACQVACKDKNDLEVGRNYRRVYEQEGGDFVEGDGGSVSNTVYAYTLSIACNHCDEPACVKNCPTGAMHKREGDGIVLVNTDQCIGCGICAKVCPYEAPQMNTAAKKMSKCNFCIDLLEKGERPVCVMACPLGAIECGTIDDLREKHGMTSDVEGLPDKEITKPNLVIRPHPVSIEK